MPMRNPKFSHSIEVVWELPESIKALRKLSTNFRWTWHHETRDLFRGIDKDLWDSSHHNPVAFLNSIDRDRLARLATDNVFLAKLRACEVDLDEYLAADSWYSQLPNKEEGERFAYF
jgi:glycogen phosphorylase